MNEMICPNYQICKLVTTKGFSGDEQRRQEYMDEYCIRGKEKWSACKRYITKKALNFCPDFVLPDTTLSPDEIIDKFDEQNQ